MLAIWFEGKRSDCDLERRERGKVSESCTGTWFVRAGDCSGILSPPQSCISVNQSVLEGRASKICDV